MKTFASRTGTVIAAWAAVMALVWAVFVPYRYPWPSLAWTVLAGAAAVWVAKKSARPILSMSEVISSVEADLRAPRAPARRVSNRLR